MPTVKILDYGSGNLEAILSIYKRLGVSCSVAKFPSDLEDASHLVLPGVGAFDTTMELLHRSGMIPSLNQSVLDRKIPVIGICVGMQIMARSSEEGKLGGLGWFDAEVKKLDTTQLRCKPFLPHMGWNGIVIKREDSIMNGVDCEKGFYFLHSFHFRCSDTADILTTTNYGRVFTSSVAKENIFGFQFHPEKSHQNGVRIFANFASMK